MYGEGTCWEELCFDECYYEQTACERWHAVGEYDDGEVEWISEPCDQYGWSGEDDWDYYSDDDDWQMESWDEDDMMMVDPEEVQMAADFLVTNFNGTAAQAFNKFCPDGQCVTDMVDIDVNGAVDMVSQVLEDKETNDVVSQLSQDLTNAFGEDFAPLQAITEMDHEDRKATLNAAIGQVAEDLAHEDWLGVLGSFVAGDQNEGRERKGKRGSN